MHKKNIAIIFGISLLLNMLLAPAGAKAWVTATTATTTVGAGAGITGATGTYSIFGVKVSELVANQINATIVVATKIATLMGVQTITKAIIGDGGGGVITDWNKYLYISPQQRAMTQMNNFFNTVSQGRLSYLNYEGVGPVNYDAYLVAQARMTISGQPFRTNLQNYCSDPSQMFAANNMKCLMTYMQCANNVACYTLVSTAQYKLEIDKAKEIALREQSNGFLPVRKDGKIVQPAAIAQAALTQLDQLGTQIIMNADPKDKTAAVTQIIKGGLITIGARSLNYAVASDEGKAAIRNKNDEFPFSLGYTLGGGLGLSAGGVTINTGAGAMNLQVRIGNTCAAAAGTVDGGGVTINIDGRKLARVDGKEYDCATKQEFTGTKPSGNFTPPSISCVNDAACNPGVIPAGYFKCVNKKCTR